MQILNDRDGIAILRTSETLTGDLSTQAAAATQVLPRRGARGGYEAMKQR